MPFVSHLLRLAVTLVALARTRPSMCPHVATTEGNVRTSGPRSAYEDLLVLFAPTIVALRDAAEATSELLAERDQRAVGRAHNEEWRQHPDVLLAAIDDPEIVDRVLELVGGDTLRIASTNAQALLLLVLDADVRASQLHATATAAVLNAVPGGAEAFEKLRAHGDEIDALASTDLLLRDAAHGIAHKPP